MALERKETTPRPPLVALKADPYFQADWFVWGFVLGVAVTSIVAWLIP